MQSEQKRSAEIVGVGHCCQDSLCTVEAYPPEDGSTHILAIDDSQGGGAVATALVAAARLGASASVIANLGDDDTGERILSGFACEGVDASCVRRIAGGRSSASIVMVHPAHGTRTKFPYRDDLPPIAWDEAQRARLRGAGLLHLDGTHWPNAMAAAHLAREAGVPVSLDGCSRQQDNEKNLQLSDLADILIMNAKYPFAVSGESDIEGALRFFARRRARSALAMTRGAEGCFALIDGEIRHFPAFPVQAVDTTGAGDVFHGAFLAEWLREPDMAHCIRFACAVSALKCQRIGGRQGIPTREEALRFLSSFS